MRAGWRAGVAGAFGVLFLWAMPVHAFAAGNPHAGKTPPGQARKAARLLQAPAGTPVPLPSVTPAPPPRPSPSAAVPTSAPAAPAPAALTQSSVAAAPAAAAPAAVLAPPVVVPPSGAAPAAPAATPAPPAAPVEVRTVVRTVSAPPAWLPAFLLTLLGGLLLLAVTLTITVRAHIASRRRFLSAAAHDLRTPLSVIRGYVEMAQEGTLGEVPPALADALPVMGTRAAELERTIRKLLEEAGKGELDPD